MPKITIQSVMANTSPRHMPVIGNVHPIKSKMELLTTWHFLMSWPSFWRQVCFLRHDQLFVVLKYFGLHDKLFYIMTNFLLHDKLLTLWQTFLRHDVFLILWQTFWHHDVSPSVVVRAVGLSRSDHTHSVSKVRTRLDSLLSMAIIT